MTRDTKEYKINKTTDRMFKVGGSFGRGEMCIELHAEIGCRGKRSYGEVVTLPKCDTEPNVPQVND